MSNKFIVLIFGFLTILPSLTILSMEEPEEKIEKQDQNGRPKKKLKLDHQYTQCKLQAFLDLPDYFQLEIFKNLPSEAESNVFEQIEESSSFMSEVNPLISELPEEAKAEITITIFSSKKLISACGINKRLYRNSSEVDDEKSKNLKQALEFLLIERSVKKNHDIAIKALFKAIQNSKMGVLKSLIKAGVDINSIHDVDLWGDTKSMTPLIFAIHEVIDGKTIEILILLLQAKANPNLAVGHHEPTPLLYILRDEKASLECKEKIISMLLEAGANPNFEAECSRCNALSFILDQSNNHKYLNILKLLLDYGANPFIDLGKLWPKEYVTLIRRVQLDKNKAIREIIQQHSHNKLLLDTAKTKNLVTLDILTAQEDLELPNFDINAPDENGYTALMHAIVADWDVGVSGLLFCKANHSLVAKDGQTALSIAKNAATRGSIQYCSSIIAWLKQYGAK